MVQTLIASSLYVYRLGSEHVVAFHCHVDLFTFVNAASALADRVADSVQR